MAVESLFPVIRSVQDFERVVRDEAALGPGVEALCAELGLAGPRRRFAGGSRPVYAVGEELVLKLYSPLDLDEQAREAAILQVLAGRLPIQTPRFQSGGTFEGWGYVVMDRLRGELLADAWPRIEPAERQRLAVELGQALRVLHAVRDPRLELARVDWAAFLAQQRETAPARQRARNLAEGWIEQIPAFLAGVWSELSAAPCQAFLHTEVMREHLLVERTASGWKLSGTFDFEPSLLGGDAEYEFKAVGIFVSCGDPTLFRRVLLGYGHAAGALDAALERRLLAYAILHKYSNLAWYLERIPAPPGLTKLDDLAAHWFGVGPDHAA